MRSCYEMRLNTPARVFLYYLRSISFIMFVFLSNIVNLSPIWSLKHTKMTQFLCNWTVEAKQTCKAEAPGLLEILTMSIQVLTCIGAIGRLQEPIPECMCVPLKRPPLYTPGRRASYFS